MVGYDPNNPSNFNHTEQFFVGAATSIASRFFVQPLDVVKIRFQLQHEAISKKSIVSKYHSIGQCVKTIFKEEGILGLWKGHLTGQILSFSFITTQFMWFNQLTKTAFLRYSFGDSPVNHFVCGGLAAGLTVFSSQPIDVIRTRLVAQGEPRMYKGMVDAASQIYVHEGIRGFYKGTIPSICLSAPEAAFRFGIYQFLNKYWEKPKRVLLERAKSRGMEESLGEREIGAIQSSVNGGISGMCAKTIVYPFDLIKKRLQIQGFEEARVTFGRHVKYSGFVDCVTRTVQEEGILGLYKGYLPSLGKAWMASTLVFFFYEQFANFARKIKSDQN